MKNLLSILLVTYEFPPHMNIGGIGTYMFHLAHLLSSAGHRVTVFSAKHTNRSIEREKLENYTNYLFPALTQDEFRESVRIFFHDYIKSEQIDVIESPEVGACALGIKQDHPHIPLVIRLHTPGVIINKVSNTYQPFLKKLRFVIGALRRGRLDLGYWAKTDKNRAQDPEYIICLLADQLVSPSQALANYLARYWQLNKLIKIVPNSFQADENIFQYPLEGREKLICFVGKLTVLKGMFKLTKAVRMILKRHPDFRVVFIGRDEFVSENMPSMRAWMENELHDIIDRVQFTGAISRQEVQFQLGRSMVCIVSSLWENYPTVLMEAMAAGAAVTASNRGGIPEIIENKKTGYLFNPMKPAAIASSVSKLIATDMERYKIAAAARRWVKNSQPDVEQSILNLYQSLVKY